MSLGAEIAARLTAALDTEAGAQATLVSITVTMAQPGAIAAVATEVARKTRTLLFLHAEARDASGALVARAESVHKLNP